VAESKTERLLQVVLCLTQGPRYVTKDQLREAVPDYAACPTTEAFERMFERDKNELRELGVPLETGPAGVVDEDPGYRIDRDAYALPDLHLTRDEMTAVALAARVWRERGPAAAAARALVKLQAEGVDVDAAALPAIEPRLSGGESAFEPLTLAVGARRPVRFAYRGPRDSEPRERHLEPWGVASLRGRWYVVGFDRDRGAERVFRMSRIEGQVELDGSPGAYEVPDGVDVRARVGDFDAERPRSTARLRLAPGAGHGLRRRGTRLPDDPDVFEVSYVDTRALADEVAAYGAAVLVEDPPELRTAVVERLRGALASAAGTIPDAP
jgi:proteasome accessory factor B